MNVLGCLGSHLPEGNAAAMTLTLNAANRENAYLVFVHLACLAFGTLDSLEWALTILLCMRRNVYKDSLGGSFN